MPLTIPIPVDPSLEEILAGIDPEWHADFVRFVQTGKASQEFLDVLDDDETLQEAVERAIFADEADIRDHIESSTSPEQQERQEYETVLRDAKLAAAALEEATKIAASREHTDSKVNAALDDALRASRSAVATLLAACGG